MAHFAKLNENNEVVQVIVVRNSEIMDENGYESEQKGIEFCESHFGAGPWIQTSYTGSFRKRYGGVGTVYLEEYDIFVPPKPWPSWVLNRKTGDWEPPVPYPPEHGRLRPEDGKYMNYEWDEENQQWINPTLSA
jgi:hypothetical protein